MLSNKDYACVFYPLLSHEETLDDEILTSFKYSATWIITERRTLNHPKIEPVAGRWTQVTQWEIQFEITVFRDNRVTISQIAIQGNSARLRNKGDFELTKFAIAGFDCIYRMIANFVQNDFYNASELKIGSSIFFRK